MDTMFVNEIERYGAKNFKACFDCGTCTAVCNLSEPGHSFPRYFVRLARTGARDEILKSRELWLCYACGDCSENCPRNADPAELIAALRRYTIASYEPTGLTKLIFKNNPVYILLTLVLAVILAMLLLSFRPESDVSRWLFQYVDYQIIHYGGILLALLLILSVIYGFVRSVKNYASGGKAKFWDTLKETTKEVGIFKRYLKCDTYDDSYWNGKPWYIKPWFLHLTIFWGFVLLFVATGLDYLFKDPNIEVWWPTRILGTIGGLSLIYGSSLIMGYRVTKPTKIYLRTKMADWIFLIFIWLTGFTGLWLEIAIFAHNHTMLTHFIFLVHIICAAEMFLLFSFSKFAHTLYRPIALFNYYKTKL